MEGFEGERTAKGDGGASSNSTRILVTRGETHEDGGSPFHQSKNDGPCDPYASPLITKPQDASFGIRIAPHPCPRHLSLPSSGF